MQCFAVHFLWSAFIHILLHKHTFKVPFEIISCPYLKLHIILGQQLDKKIIETIKISFSFKGKTHNCWNVSFSNYTIPGMPPPLVCFNAVGFPMHRGFPMRCNITFLTTQGHRGPATPDLLASAQSRAYIHRLLLDINYATMFSLELQLDLGLSVSGFHLSQQQQL